MIQDEISIFANLHVSHATIFRNSKLHNSLFVSIAKRKLREPYRTAIHCIVKFRVLHGTMVCAHEFSLAEGNFEEKSPFVQANYRSICHEI